MDGRVSNQALVPIILTLPTPLVLCMALRACRRRRSRAPPSYFAAVRSYWDSAFDIRSARSLHPSNRTAAAAAALSSRRVTTSLAAAIAAPALQPRETWIFCGVCLWGEITIHISIILPIIWSLVPYNGRTLCTIASAVQCDARYV